MYIFFVAKDAILVFPTPIMVFIKLAKIVYLIHPVKQLCMIKHYSLNIIYIFIINNNYE